MSSSTVAKPFSKLKRVRSLDELRTRGVQAVSAYRERKHMPQVPTDEEFAPLLDNSFFGSTPIIAESIWQRFFNQGEESFFPPLRRSRLAGKEFKEIFGSQVAGR